MYRSTRNNDFVGDESLIRSWPSNLDSSDARNRSRYVDAQQNSWLYCWHHHPGNCIERNIQFWCTSLSNEAVSRCDGQQWSYLDCETMEWYNRRNSSLSC